MTNIYRLALQVQDASNISGVIESLHREVLPAIRDESGYREMGTVYMAEHPALILFLDKIVSLTHVGFIHDLDSKISQAYDDCRTMGDALDAVEAQNAATEAKARLLYPELEIAERNSILAQRQADRAGQ